MTRISAPRVFRLFRACLLSEAKEQPKDLPPPWARRMPMKAIPPNPARQPKNEYA
jgi:hypothetical protein